MALAGHMLVNSLPLCTVLESIIVYWMLYLVLSKSSLDIVKMMGNRRYMGGRWGLPLEVGWGSDHHLYKRMGVDVGTDVSKSLAWQEFFSWYCASDFKTVMYRII